MLEFPILTSNNNSKIYTTLIIKNFAYKNPNMRILFDTGASLPAWVGGFDSFQKRFPDSIFENAETILKGFGKGFEIAPVYKIPEFILKDNQNNKIVIKNMPIVVTNRDYSFDMILSFTSLRKINYKYISYTYKNGTYNEINPKFRIYPHKKIYYLNPLYKFTKDLPLNLQKYFEQPKVLENVYVFNQ